MAATPMLSQPKEEVTTLFQTSMNTLSLHEEVSVGVIAGVLTIVFITLLAFLVVIIIYLYKNKGSYHTYEQPEAEASIHLEDLPSQGEKTEYFI